MKKTSKSKINKDIKITNSMLCDSRKVNPILKSMDNRKMIREVYAKGYVVITTTVEPLAKKSLYTERISKKNKSIKLRNIIVNIKPFISSLPEITTSTVGIIVDIPILKVCAILSTLKTILGLMTVEISENQATVIYALWKNCDNNDKIKLEKGFNSTNRLLRSLNEAEMDWETYIKTVQELDLLQCLHMSDDGLWLRERVYKSYSR